MIAFAHAGHLAKTRARATKRGFTLTEIAIVLGIIGLILGAIWTAAAAVYSNQKINTAQSAIMTVIQGARSLYATSSTTGDAVGTDETPALIAAGVFPANLAIGGGTTPWGASSTFKVYSQQASVVGDSLLVELNGIPAAQLSTACISLQTSLTGPGRDSGLWVVSANTATQKSAGLTTQTTLPISASTANTNCVAKNGFLDFMFLLKG
jgi:prepilin-type N-terminal cleavage/methylation domain-containing protein